MRILPLAALPLILSLASPASAQQPVGEAPQPQAQPLQEGAEATAPLTVEVTPTAPAPPDEGTGTPDPGFRVEIRGLPGEVDAEEFGRSVLAALPEQLLDPQQNFTRAETFRRDADYRLLMVFHDIGDEPPLAQLCAQPEKADAIATAQPPQFQDLTATTRIAAAFCRDEETLSTATDQVTGEVMPGQASFRFLVGDVAKQLFPSGFTAIPGTPAALTAIPPG